VGERAAEAEIGLIAGRESVAISVADSSEPISNSAKRGGAGLALFGGFFAVVGFAALIPIFILPVFHSIQALRWREVPCTILQSQVVSHHSDKGGPTYSIKISFKYDVGNAHYVGSRYNFSLGSSSGFDYRQAIVRRLHRGVRTVCYVDPADPADAVIDRGLSRDLWFGLLPLLFAIIGVAIIVFAVRNAHPQPTNAAQRAAPIRTGDSDRLKDAQSPLRTLIALGVMCLFWNGIVSVFVHQAYFGLSGRADFFDWFQRIFCIPFILVGVLLIIVWFHQLLAVFNPRPHIVLSNQSLTLGQSSQLSWNFTGNASRIGRLSIHVEGREVATHLRSGGHNSDERVTQKSTFARLPIADTTRKMEIATGRGTFTIPADSMHSFASRNNKIEWSIVLHGEISGWADVKAEFPINIAPMAVHA
jgi:hypothetical protein